jgi:hypothetical protein
MAEQEVIPSGLPIPGPGRDSKYRVEFNEQARKLCLLGAVDAELADFFGVTETTINNWKLKHPAFLESIREGKTIADAEVADSLYRRATGENIIVEKLVKRGDEYEKVFLKQFVPGDVAAQRLWLLNRRNRDWRDKVDTHHTGEVSITRIERRVID